MKKSIPALLSVFLMAGLLFQVACGNKKARHPHASRNNNQVNTVKPTLTEHPTLRNTRNNNQVNTVKPTLTEHPTLRNGGEKTVKPKPSTTSPNVNEERNGESKPSTNYKNPDIPYGPESVYP